MNSAVLGLFSAFAILCDYALTQPVKYDQRQEGDLNVRTDVEDVVFVMVMPQDIITGMGLVAANAADILKKNYGGGIGPERWPVRTPTKVGFVPLEKSPYKIDLEKSGIKVKKISQAGDPNRYNFNDGKNPTKVTPEVRITTSTEIPDKSTMDTTTEMTGEMQSTTENKTVKKVLKPEESKRTTISEEKKPEDTKKTTISAEKKPEDTKKTTIPEEKKPVEEKKEVDAEKVKKPEEVKTSEENISEEQPKVVGDSMDPTSILRIEGCGPDAKRDSTGRNVKCRPTGQEGLIQIQESTD